MTVQMKETKGERETEMESVTKKFHCIKFDQYRQLQICAIKKSELQFRFLLKRDDVYTVLVNAAVWHTIV